MRTRDFFFEINWPLVEIGLTDLPKSGRDDRPHPLPLGSYGSEKAMKNIYHDKVTIGAKISVLEAITTQQVQKNGTTFSIWLLILGCFENQDNVCTLYVASAVSYYI